MKSIISLLLLVASFGIIAQEITGPELLDRSIAFHDPDGKWDQSILELVIHMKRPEGSVRPSNVIVDNKNGMFELRQIAGGTEKVWMVDEKDTCSFLINYRSPVNQVEADSLNLTSYQARRMRDYYSYLYGLPMKLKDRGTNIDPTVQKTSFQGKEVLAMKVTYDKEVGEDIWYFYFNPNTYAMEGYRFFHDESINDGEYITLEGMSISNGMRIPKNRSWYYNKDDKFLATDFLIDMKIKN